MAKARITPARAPVAPGEKRTSKVQLSPAASGRGEVLSASRQPLRLTAKSPPAWVVSSWMPPVVGRSAALETRNIWVAPAEPTGTMPKSWVAGSTPIWAAGVAVPEMATAEVSVWLAPATMKVPVAVRVVALAPGVVGMNRTVTAQVAPAAGGLVAQVSEATT